MAFTRRVLAGLVAIVTVVLGVSLAVAGPAAAATGSWKAYGNTNPITSSPSTWRCASTVKLATNVGAQACAIRSQSGDFLRGAVIVRNNGSTLFRVDAEVRLWSESGDWLNFWTCQASGVGANSWSVCFGENLQRRSQARASGHANSVSLGQSPMI